MRKINLIVVHCTATPEGRDVTVADIDRMHRARGWKKIGYHYVVYRDGSVHEGRPVNEVGAHVYGHNANSIGVVYVGGVAKDGNICGHRDLSPDLNHDGKIEPSEWVKACPCFNAEEEYEKL